MSNLPPEGKPALSGQYYCDKHRGHPAYFKPENCLVCQLKEAREFAEEAAKKYNKLLNDRSVISCAFCDMEYPPGTPPSQHEALTAHVMVCAEHPLRARIEELEKRQIRKFSDLPDAAEEPEDQEEIEPFI